MNIANSRPSDGVNYKYWVEIIGQLLNDQSLELPPKHELDRWFREDFSYEEVVQKELFKKTQNVWMECHVKHEFGKFNIRFNTTEQAKDFFRKYPEIREKMEK